MSDLYLEDLELGHFLERDIQDYFCACLDAKGIEYHYERYTETDHRADLVVGNTVVEFKKYLAVSKINEARGQAEHYAEAFGVDEILVVGVTPQSARSAAAAQNLADAINSTSKRVRIMFIDRDPEYCPPRRSVYQPKPQQEPEPIYYYRPSSDDIPAPLVALAMFVVGLVIFGSCSQMGKNSKFRGATHQTGMQRNWFRVNETEQLAKAKYKALEGSYGDAAQIYQRVASETQTTCVKNYSVRLRNVSVKAQQLKELGKNREDIREQFKISLQDVADNAAAVDCPVKISAE